MQQAHRVDDETPILNCFNAYGLRKGPATQATSGTTHAPVVPTSVAHQGDWSMGKVFDIYWRFLPQGDHYLGQVLSGNDPERRMVQLGNLDDHID